MSNIKHRPIFLLSIDGGGVLGLLALRILSHIEQRMNRPIASLFDAIAGVSVGGIIALGLGVPDVNKSRSAYSAQHLSNLFLENMSKIFKRTPMHHLAHQLPILGIVDALFFSKYRNHYAHELYKKWFKETCMSQSLIQTIIPAYNISGSVKKSPRIKVFDSLEILEKKQKLSKKFDFFMHDIALATSAAPTYFPPHRMRYINAQHESILSDDYFIDGGIAINDPTILAYARLRKRYPHSPIHILSLGVGTPSYVYKNILKNNAPGLLPWTLKIGDLIVSPQLSVYTKLLEHLQKGAPSPGHYWRIESMDASLKSHLDDVSPQHIKNILDTAHRMLDHYQHDLDAIIFYLSEKHKI